MKLANIFPVLTERRQTHGSVEFEHTVMFPGDPSEDDIERNVTVTASVVDTPDGYDTGDSPDDVEVTIDEIFDPLTKKTFPLSHFTKKEQANIVDGATQAWSHRR